MPGFSSAFRKARKAPPKPPAAPAPGTWVISLPVVEWINREKDCIPTSNFSIIVSSAPFCRAKTCAAPSGPQKGLRTSQAIVKRVSLSAGWTEEKSIAAIRCRISPPFPKTAPSLSRNRAPNACNRPTPASFVALPPIPMTNSRYPCSIACNINSPVP